MNININIYIYLYIYIYIYIYIYVYIDVRACIQCVSIDWFVMHRRTSEQTFSKNTRLGEVLEMNCRGRALQRIASSICQWGLPTATRGVWTTHCYKKQLPLGNGSTHKNIKILGMVHNSGPCPGGAVTASRPKPPHGRHLP